LAEGAGIISSAGSSNWGSCGHVSEALGEGEGGCANGNVLANKVGGDAKGGSGRDSSAGVGSAAEASGVAAGLNASCRYSASSGEGNWGSVLEVSVFEELGRDCSEAEGSNNDCLEHGLFVCYF
jgi:hypothetical protein